MMQNHLLSLCLAAITAAAAGTAATAEAPVVRLQTTAGDIDVKLLPTEAPRTVENFLRLVDNRFYDGLVFHRVLANFVIQAGGYDAELNYRQPPGTVANESANGLRNRRGTLAMARLADPDSADAQFFINVNDNTHLDAQPGYTVFGEVIAGMNIVASIELSDTRVQKGMAGVPATPIVILSARRLGSTNPHR